MAKLTKAAVVKNLQEIKAWILENPNNAKEIQEVVLTGSTEIQEYIENQERLQRTKGRFFDAGYYVTADGFIYNSINEESDDHLFDVGNLYKTEADAQAIVDLKTHTYQFKCPENKVDCFFCVGSGITSLFDDSWIDFDAGLILPAEATEEDKTKRIELLKKANQAHKNKLYDL